MVTTRDLINNPNFGKLYSTSHGFRGAFNQFMSGLPGIGGDNFSQFRFSVGPDQELSISLLNHAKPVSREAGQSNYEYLMKAYAQSQSSATRSRQYGPEMLRSTRTGSYGSPLMETYADIYGYEISVTSHRLDTAAAAKLQRDIGENGLVIPDSKTTNVLQVYDPANKRYRTMNEIFDMLGIMDPSREVEASSMETIYKRLKMFVNESPSQRVLTGGKRIQVLSVDPEDFFRGNQNQQVRRIVRGLADVAKGSGKTQRELFEEISDGAGYMSRSSLDRILGQMHKRKNFLEKRLSGSGMDSRSVEYNSIRKEIEDIAEEIKSIRHKSSKGLSFNYRVYNGEKVTDGSLFEYGKGEAIMLENEDFGSLVRRVTPSNTFTDKQIRAIDILLPSTAEKKELNIINQGRDALSVFAIHSEPLPDVAVSNTLTTASYGEVINPNNYMRRSLESAMKNDVKALREGKIPAGIEALFRELENTPELGLDPAEAIRLRQSKEFVYRLKSFMANGGDLRENPYLMGQLMDHVRQHYFPMSSKFKGFKFESGARDPINARIPQGLSTRAHIESAALRGEGRTDVLAIDHAAGRFRLSAASMIKAREAFGGFDLDDSLYSVYRYDTKTKRLLAFTLRDPNSMGEYYIFDADITHDKNIPQEIRDLWKRREKLQKDLRKGRRGGKVNGVDRKVDEYNKISNRLDEYFRQADFIEDIDVNKMFTVDGMPTPAGTRRTTASMERYNRRNVTLSMNVIDPNMSAKELSKLMQDEHRMLLGPHGFSPFEYAPGYNQYHEDFFRVYKAGDGAARPKVAGRLTVNEMYRRLAIEADSGSRLGVAINQYTLIDSFISSHLDFAGTGDIDPRIKSKLKDLLKANRFDIVGREDLIDALTKGTDSTAVLQFIEQAEDSNMTKLGQIMRQLQDYADAEGIEFKAGLDPAVFEERSARQASQIEALKVGFGGDDFLLSDLDPKAHHARMVNNVLEIRELFDNLKDESVKETNKLLSETIGNNFSPQQLQKASEIIGSFEEGRAALRGMDIEELLSAALADPTNPAILDEMSKISVHGRTLAAMRGMGKDDVLAIARVLIDSGGDLAMLNQATPFEGGHSVADIYNRALGQDRTMANIMGISGYDDLADFINYDRTTGAYSYSESAQSVINTRARDQAMLDKIRRYKSDQFADIEMHRAAGQPIDASRSVGHLLGYEQFVESQLAQSSETVQIPEQIGALHSKMRTASDEAANAVTARPMPTRIKSLKWSDLAASKSARSAMVAIAAFAGIGIVHKLVTGDRTHDQANPYPLIPEGSQYERIATDAQFYNSPTMNSSGGMTYQISGQYTGDSNALISGVQGVLPQGSTTIYKSGAPSYGGYQASSERILMDRLGY